MTRRIYLAGASAEAALVASYGAQLRAAGWTITHDWTPAVLKQLAAGRTDADLTPTERQKAATDDWGAICRADVFWLLIPDGTASFGAGVELGLAAVVGGPELVVSGAWRRSIFTSLADLCFDTHDKALAYLESLS